MRQFPSCFQLNPGYNPPAAYNDIAILYLKKGASQHKKNLKMI